MHPALDAFLRRTYTDGPTPLEPMARLGAEVGGLDLWVKRDDLLGLSPGGNKTRKLEYLVADALAKGAKTLVTVGAPQSNHCRITATAAAREGLACRLLIEERVPGSFSRQAPGNHLLFELLGVDRIRCVPKGTDLLRAMADLAEDADEPYLIPTGGSVPLGALGYARAAVELLEQADAFGWRPDRIVVASGSGGTHAGLLSGLALLGLVGEVRLTGVSVSRPHDAQVELLAAEVAGTCALLGIDPPPTEAIEVEDGYVGEGYSIPTDGMVDAVRLLGRTEALLLDPVYTGKAMAGLLDLARTGSIAPTERVVFVHTGGSPALHRYADTFLA